MDSTDEGYKVETRGDRNESGIGRDIRPDPDPTRLTSQLVDVAIAAVREILETRILAIENAQAASVRAGIMAIDNASAIINTRLDGMDRAIELVQRTTDRLPSESDLKIKGIQLFFDERFASVFRQFEAQAQLTQQMSMAAKEAVGTALQAAKEAVAAALQAAKEAVGAQSASSDKRIDEIRTLLSTSTGALDAKISVITEQSKNTMTRQEVEQLFRAITDKLDGPTGLSVRFENMFSRVAGREDLARVNTSTNQWAIGAILGGLALLIALVTLALNLRQ